MSDPYSDSMPPKTQDEADKLNPGEDRRAFAFEVDSLWSGKRLDAFLASCLAVHGVSRQRVKQLILNGEVKVGGEAAKLPRQLLASGQTVCLNLADFAETSPEAQAGSLSIVFQGPDFLVVDKPPYLTVHPCPSCPRDTLVNIMLYHFPQLSQLPGLRPGIVHRLDKDTSGLLLIALNEAARLKFSEAFAERRVHKEYLALVMGRPQPESGRIVQPIARHPTLKTKMAVMRGGKEAISEYRTIFSGGADEAEFSVLAVKIHTGRTHQIRVHLAHLGHPIWGDSLYGGARSLTGKKTASGDALSIAGRQMLHAWKLCFECPDTGEKLSFKSSLPSDFTDSLSRLLSSPP
ncbi:MAG: RluA family pseudouridine synthase, partial [Desulfovibrionaceae bacterium]|nr:RluA family pseudouridine synthase [Desulfovibrionaceae bacterium]